MTKDQPPRRSGLTQPGSAVQRLVTQATEAMESEGKTGAGKPGHAGQTGQDKTGRQKMTIDLSLDRQQQLKKIANAEGVNVAELAGYAIARLIADYEAGKVDIGSKVVYERSEKQPWKSIARLRE